MSEPPNSFICPITQEVMRDPVVCALGHSYERRAIERWLLDHDTSPKSNQVLPHKHLTPNLNLRQAIAELGNSQTITPLPSLQTAREVVFPEALVFFEPDVPLLEEQPAFVPVDEPELPGRLRHNGELHILQRQPPTLRDFRQRFRESMILSCIPWSKKLVKIGIPPESRNYYMPVHNQRAHDCLERHKFLNEIVRREFIFDPNTGFCYREYNDELHRVSAWCMSYHFILIGYTEENDFKNLVMYGCGDVGDAFTCHNCSFLKKSYRW